MRGTALLVGSQRVVAAAVGHARLVVCRFLRRPGAAIRSPVPLAACSRESGAAACGGALPAPATAAPSVSSGPAAAAAATGGGAKDALADASSGALGSIHRLSSLSKYIVLSSPNVAFFPFEEKAELMLAQPHPPASSSLLIVREKARRGKASRQPRGTAALHAAASSALEVPLGPTAVLSR